MTSVFGHPAGTAPRHGRVWYWSRRRVDRIRTIARGLRTVAAFGLGMLCVGLAGKVIGPALETSHTRLAPAAVAAPESRPVVAAAPVAAPAPAAEPVGRPAAKPVTVEAPGTATTGDQPRAASAQRNAATGTETDGRAAASSPELAGGPKDPAAEPSASGERQTTAPESASATTERRDAATRPTKQASHKAKRRVAKQNHNEWANGWNNNRRYSQWGYAAQPQPQWRPW